MRKNNPQSGFTITEVLVVISLIAILTALFVSLLIVPAMKNSQVSRTKQSFKNIESATEKFKRDYGACPALTGTAITNAIGGGNNFISWYESNTTNIVLQGSAIHDRVEQNACVFLQLCIPEVTDSSGTRHTIGNGEPALEPNNTIAALIKVNDQEIAENNAIFNVFVDAWRTPLRIDILTSDKIVLESAGPDKQWGTDDDLGNNE